MFLSERHFLTPYEQSLAFLTNQSCSLFQVYQKRRTEHLMKKDMRLKMLSLKTYGETILFAQKKGKKDCHLVISPWFHTVGRTAWAQTKSKLYISGITGDHMFNFCCRFFTRGSIKGNYFNHGLGNQSFTLNPGRRVKLIFSLSYCAAISPIPKHVKRECLLLLNFRRCSQFYSVGTLPQNQCFSMTWNNRIHSRTLDSRGSLRSCVSSTSSVVLAVSSQEQAGVSSRSLHSQTGECSREENQPCHPLQGPRCPLGTREPLRQLRGAWNGIQCPSILSWMKNEPPYPFPSSAGIKQSKAWVTVTGDDGWGCGGRFCWQDFRTWAFPDKPWYNGVGGSDQSFPPEIIWEHRPLFPRMCYNGMLKWATTVQCVSSPGHHSQESLPAVQGGGQAAQGAL